MRDPITDREIGEALNQLAQTRHDLRNLRQQYILMADQLEKMRIAHTKLQTRLTTIVSIGVGAVAVAGWILEISLR